MDLIIISPPEDRPAETALVGQILKDIPATFHLRKPGCGPKDVADYLERIPSTLHRRIMVHGHRRLLERFDLKGIHFAESARLHRPEGLRQLRRDRPDCRISSAFHRIATIPEPDGLLDYLMLSPIFDSISKPGYAAAFAPADLKRFLSRTAQRVIALGGIDGSTAPTAAALGFAGIAVLGAVWKAPDPVRAARRLWAICRRIATRSD